MYTLVFHDDGHFEFGPGVKFAGFGRVNVDAAVAVGLSKGVVPVGTMYYRPLLGEVKIPGHSWQIIVLAANPWQRALHVAGWSLAEDGEGTARGGG